MLFKIIGQLQSHMCGKYDIGAAAPSTSIMPSCRLVLFHSIYAADLMSFVISACFTSPTAYVDILTPVLTYHESNCFLVI
jgi:hypothetical protein